MLNIVRALACPLPVKVGDRRLLISPPCSRMRGMLLAWLADRDDLRDGYLAATGEDPPPCWLPRVSAHASISALVADGLDLLVYAATRRDHPDLSLEECGNIAAMLMEDPAILEKVTQVATLGMLARDVPKATDRDNTPTDRGNPDGHEGLEATDFGILLECAQVRRFSPREIGHLSVDQLENAVRGGKWDLVAAGRPMTQDQATEYIMACRRAIDEGREVPECPF